MTPNSYRIARKLAAAKNMLADTDLSISEIALSINIPDSLYFSRLFTKKIGMSPSEYRKMHSFNV
jgi:AraC-like DNA-binding protein